jgi:hypothetical protein
MLGGTTHDRVPHRPVVWCVMSSAAGQEAQRVGEFHDKPSGVVCKLHETFCGATRRRALRWGGLQPNMRRCTWVCASVGYGRDMVVSFAASQPIARHVKAISSTAR